jgi:hypothetical protein
VEHHAFFRLRQPATGKASQSDFTRLGSRFRFRLEPRGRPLPDPPCPEWPGPAGQHGPPWKGSLTGGEGAAAG